MTTPEENLRNYKKKKNSKVLVVFLVISVLYVIGSLGSNSSNTDASSSEGAAAEVDTSWVPAGFSIWPDDQDIAWRWAKGNEVNCSYSTGACWSALVISKNGCKTSMYGEISIFDKSDVQIGYTNDTLSAVLPMQKSKFTFDTFNDQADSARLSKISCY